jgi:hypothetical protein
MKSFMDEVCPDDPKVGSDDNPLNGHSMTIEETIYFDSETSLDRFFNYVDIDDRNEVIRDSLLTLKENFENFFKTLSQNNETAKKNLFGYPGYRFCFPDFVEALQDGSPENNPKGSDFLIDVLTIFAALNKFQSVTVKFEFNELLKKGNEND